MEDITFKITKVPQYFKMITLLKDILSQTNFHFKPNGIYGNTLTDSKIGLIEFFIPKEQLENYNCEHTKVIGINLASYYTILKVIGIKVPNVSYKISKEDTMTLSAPGKRKTDILMYLLDIDTESLTPDNEYDAIVKMDSKELYSVIKDLNDLGDEIVITVDEKSISFGTDNTSIAKTNFAFDNLEITCDEPITMKYTGKELLKYVKAYSFASTVDLYFCKDLPLSIHYSCDEDFGWFRMFLAPMSE
jgi:proliferating cell nuclear antigen PCNA